MASQYWWWKPFTTQNILRSNEYTNSPDMETATKGIFLLSDQHSCHAPCFVTSWRAVMIRYLLITCYAFWWWRGFVLSWLLFHLHYDYNYVHVSDKHCNQLYLCDRHFFPALLWFTTLNKKSNSYPAWWQKHMLGLSLVGTKKHCKLWS